MIDCFTWADAHLFGDALSGQFRLRHNVFIEALGWSDLEARNGMEWDQYDTPATVYLTKRDENGRVIGTFRLVTTDTPYMIRDLWPERASRLPDSPTILEGTRLAVAQDLDQRTSRRVCLELIAASIDYAVQTGCTEILHVSPLVIMKGILKRNGLVSTWLSDPWECEGDTIVISSTRSLPEDLNHLKARLGVEGSFIRRSTDLPALHAAA